MSDLFSFEITVAASPAVDDGTIEADLLGAPACLVMQAGASEPRYVRGIVAAVSAQRAVHGRLAVYRVRLVPTLWLLKKQTTSRIFQDQTVPEIVAAVLEQAGVPYALHLLGKYRPRTYCVQHGETDFAFVARLLAEEGIFYTFDHGGLDAKAEIVSLSDSARAYPAIEGDLELAYRPHQSAAGMAQGEHHVQQFELRRSLRSTSVFRRGYDFRRPALDLVAEAKLEDRSGGEPARGEIYAHHEEDEEPNIRPETVKAELEQHRAGVEVAQGSSGCRRLVPGARFKLRDHDLGRLDAEYVVTRVKHEGRSPETATPGEPVYANTFECLPATVAARPPRPARTLHQVTETAIVVGPEGQEIYTDDYGRVKVQFHWDREGQRDERSSCWIRVAQAWAGSGWGGQFIPRIGMEVVVVFLGGDVDRPMIVGSVYNAANLPPLKLPEKKTQSGIRSQSTPGGGGYNEIMFEDTAGGELLSIRAQRNLDESASNDIRSTAGRDHVTATGRNASRDVDQNDALHVGGNRTVRVDGALFEHVAGGAGASFAGDRHARVSGDDTVEAAGGHTLQAATFSHVLIGHGNKDGGHGFVLVNGNYRIAAADELLLSAKNAVRLSCGTSEILITPEGVKITTPKLELAVTETLTCTGQGNTIRLGEHIEIKGDLVQVISKKASIVMDDDVTIKGTKIKLNSGEPRPAESKDDSAAELGDVIFQIDPKFKAEGQGPLTAIIATPSGDVIEKLVDANNEVKVQGKKGEHFVLLGVKCGDTALAKKPG